MKSINLSTYKILIGNDLINKLDELIPFSKYSKTVVLTDRTIGKIFLPEVTKGLKTALLPFLVDKGEIAKSLKTLETIWSFLLKNKCDRNTLIINLGGGVISDAGGFAASTYLRGIDFINIPTTLLSQVDASIGGKTAINFGGIKNIIGTFNNPIKVIIDTDTLKTLPSREFLSGFAEIIKHGLIWNREFFMEVTAKPPLDLKNGRLEEIIFKSCLIKAGIVKRDPLESGLRKILNFGHTVGHALEAISLKNNKPLLHGEAVSLGMIIESRISLLSGLLKENDVSKIQNALKYSGLPVVNKITNFKRIMKKIEMDKKNQNAKIKWTLLSGIGKAVYDQEVALRAVYKALKLNSI